MCKDIREHVKSCSTCKKRKWQWIKYKLPVKKVVVNPWECLFIVIVRLYIININITLVDPAINELAIGKNATTVSVDEKGNNN